MFKDVARICIIKANIKVFLNLATSFISSFSRGDSKKNKYFKRDFIYDKGMKCYLFLSISSKIFKQLLSLVVSLNISGYLVTFKFDIWQRGCPAVKGILLTPLAWLR